MRLRNLETIWGRPCTHLSIEGSGCWPSAIKLSYALLILVRMFETCTPILQVSLGDTNPPSSHWSRMCSGTLTCAYSVTYDPDRNSVSPKKAHFKIVPHHYKALWYLQGISYSKLAERLAFRWNLHAKPQSMGIMGFFCGQNFRLLCVLDAGSSPLPYLVCGISPLHWRT